MILPEYGESRGDGKGYGDMIVGGGSGSGLSRIAAVDLRHFGAGYGDMSRSGWGDGFGCAESGARAAGDGSRGQVTAFHLLGIPR